MIYNENGDTKVVITYEVGGWPVGFIGWYVAVEELVYNEDYTDYWYHTVGEDCEYVTE